MRGYIAYAASALQRHLNGPFALAPEELGGLLCLLDNAALSQYIYEAPFIPADEQEAQEIRLLSMSLQEGRIPSLSDLMNVLPHDGADTPEARQLLARYTYFLNLAGTPGHLRAEQLNLAYSIRGREALILKLMDFVNEFDPDSEDAHRIWSEIYMLRGMINDWSWLLAELLASDPSMGGAIRKPCRWLTRLLEQTAAFIEAFLTMPLF